MEITKGVYSEIASNQITNKKGNVQLFMITDDIVHDIIVN